MAGATNIDLSDREWLHILDDVANDEGWAETHDMAEKLGATGDNEAFTARNIGIRNAWMKRFGFILQDEKAKHRWKLTAPGREFMNGSIRSSLSSSLEKLSGPQAMSALEAVVRSHYGKNDLTKVALRRQWQNTTRTR